MHGQQNIKIPT